MTRGYEPERGHGRYSRRDDHDGRNARDRERGVPDALLIGLLLFLLGLTLLVWTATGLAGLLAHGSWPHGVSYPGTPIALRHLVAAPHDLAAAWPHTPKGQLSGYGLFWGILIGELMVLLVLTIFTLGTVTRYRAVRAARRQATRASSSSDPAAAEPQFQAATTAPCTHDTALSPAPEPPPASLQKPPAAAGLTTPPANDLHPAQRPTPAPNSPIATKPLESPEQVNATALATPPEVINPTTAPAPATASPSSPPLPHLHFGTDRTAARTTAAAAITSAEGPLIVATTDPALWTETKDARAKLGPLLTYDPTHRLDTPARLRWSPTAGCEDITTATTRAAALLAPVRPTSTLDSAVADAAQTLLRCWLHAAAVDGRPFRQLHRWAHATGAAQEPVRILRTSPKASAGQAGELESVLTAHAERREMAKELIGRALATLSSIHIRDACNPPRADSLILESFVDEGGTLYVVGEPIEDPRTNPGAMPLLTALLSHVVEHGRRMAERSSDGRLDPPLTLVLDDIAALAPLPTLPDLLESGHTRGLLTLATMRSQEQAQARWPLRPLQA
ncbi:type IV secretory system conjugative DNA transfer family protein [Streptomyces sp. NPDC053427]|uniref:type IV secretory system conjugative DNA transfer family protein n=1 Tax=Streptomyces sp. NPDC053427 TaxID=3365701 RepID=UPI0037D95CC2